MRGGIWIIGPLLVAALVAGQGCKKDETAGEKLDKMTQDTKDATKKAAVNRATCGISSS